MWTENAVFKEDLDDLDRCSFLPWSRLRGKTVLITGGTGLIGYTLTCALLYHEALHREGLRAVLLVRDKARAEAQYAAQIEEGCALSFVEAELGKPLSLDIPVDYILHAAAPTASTFFVSNPVDTMETIAKGTESILSLANEKHVDGVVFLSSMEAYGEITVKEALSEERLGYLDLASPRSSYPEAKRYAECLCHAYHSQFGTPVTIARLAQTFGPGVKETDKRVFSYMAACAREGRDIVLMTDGKKENMYTYTADAVSALLLLLLSGERGETYNIGNPDTYCSIREMGELVANTLGEGRISVRVNGAQAKAAIYPPDSFLLLDISKLRALGWSAHTGLIDMYRKMIAGY